MLLALNKKSNPTLNKTEDRQLRPFFLFEYTFWSKIFRQKIVFILLLSCFREKQYIFAKLCFNLKQTWQQSEQTEDFLIPPNGKDA
jgi:hypothetical protein